MLFFSQSTPLVEQAFRNIVRAVRKSAVLQKRVDRSVERILELKNRLQFTPLRYRSRLKARIVRQIERLRATVDQRSRTAVGRS
jgi:hypothetical protein